MHHINICFMKHKLQVLIQSNRISKICSSSIFWPILYCANIINISQPDSVQSTPGFCPHPSLFSSLRGGSPAWSPVLIHIFVYRVSAWYPVRAGRNPSNIQAIVCIHGVTYTVQISTFTQLHDLYMYTKSIMCIHVYVQNHIALKQLYSEGHSCLPGPCWGMKCRRCDGSRWILRLWQPGPAG